MSSFGSKNENQNKLIKKMPQKPKVNLICTHPMQIVEEHCKGCDIKDGIAYSETTPKSPDKDSDNEEKHFVLGFYEAKNDEDEDDERYM